MGISTQPLVASDGDSPLALRSLTELEAVIERGLTMFIEVRDALLDIRDRKLYREQYGTFEEYCQERWSISRPQAYRLMDAAGIVGVLSPIGDIPVNEAQARELVPLKDDPHRLRGRTLAGQQAESRLGCVVLNRMTHLGRPVSDQVARTALQSPT